jgi:hypothetical protein
VLEEACGQLDLVGRMAKELGAAKSLTVTGSKGQPVPHPLIDKLHQARDLEARLLDRLEVVVDEDGGNVARIAARRTARARWKKAG